VDATGNLYVPAVGLGVVLQVAATTGMTTIVAGNGGQGFTGDGGPATAATLNAPESVISDNKGDLFIVDSQNDRVRKVDAAGVISTVVGGYVGDGNKSTHSSTNWAQGIAFDPAGNLYIADTWNNRLRMVDTAGTISTIAGNGISGSTGDGGKASDAEIAEPVAVAADGLGNVYLSDFGDFAIRKIDRSGTITTFAPSVFAN